MYNKVTLIGHLGGDPQMRYMQDGTPVTNFSLAVNKNSKNPDGSRREETIWFRVAAWRKLGEIANQYLAKGKQVYVEGELSPPRIYTNNQGQPSVSFEVTAVVIKFLGTKGEGGTVGGAVPYESPAPASGGGGSRDVFEDEELPF